MMAGSRAVDAAEEAGCGKGTVKTMVGTSGASRAAAESRDGNASFPESRSRRRTGRANPRARPMEPAHDLKHLGFRRRPSKGVCPASDQVKRVCRERASKRWSALLTQTKSRIGRKCSFETEAIDPRAVVAVHRPLDDSETCSPDRLLDRLPDPRRSRARACPRRRRRPPARRESDAWGLRPSARTAGPASPTGGWHPRPQEPPCNPGIPTGQIGPSNRGQSCGPRSQRAC